MHRKDDILLAEAYKQTKQIDEGLFDRMGARYAGAKGFVQGLGQKVGAYGKGLKAAGQALTGNISGAAKTGQEAYSQLKDTQNASQRAKIDSLVSSKSKDIVNDLDKLGLNSKDAPLTTDEIGAKLKEILSSKGITPDAAAAIKPTATDETISPPAEPGTVSTTSTETPANTETELEEIPAAAVETPAAEKISPGVDYKSRLETKVNELKELIAKKQAAVESKHSFTDTSAEKEEIARFQNQLKEYEDMMKESRSFRAYFKSKFII
jgi:hypothetical protein